MYTIQFYVKKEVPVTFNHTCDHIEEIQNKILRKLIAVIIFNFTKQLNFILKGKDLRKITTDAPLIFLKAKEQWYKLYKRL